MNAEYQLNASQNYVASPISVSLLLAVLAHGLAGETLHEVISAFEIKPEENNTALQGMVNLHSELNSHAVVKVTNIVLAHPTLAPEYIDRIKAFATSEQMDMSDLPKLTSKINKYVSDNTNGLIKEIVKQEEMDGAIAMFMNTIYFKDNWAIQFESENTKDMPFLALEGQRTEKLMYSHSKKYNYHETDAYQHLELDYVTTNFSFGIVLPKDVNSQPMLLRQHEIIENVLHFRKETVNLSMPKFSQETEIDLIPMLKSIGIKKLFNNAESNMFVEPVPSFVSMMKQKAKIIVDEKGTEAAAVTVAKMMRCAMPRRETPIEFNANHPFSYYIRYKDVMLFEGMYA